MTAPDEERARLVERDPTLASVVRREANRRQERSNRGGRRRREFAGDGVQSRLVPGLSGAIPSRRRHRAPA